VPIRKQARDRDHPICAHRCPLIRHAGTLPDTVENALATWHAGKVKRRVPKSLENYDFASPASITTVLYNTLNRRG